MAAITGDRPWKRSLFRWPSIMKVLRVGSALKTHFRPRVHDADFYCLTAIDDYAGVALDIGANRGQSAVAILKLKPGFSVVSIEPNPNCQPALRLHQTLFGNRMRVIQAGASNIAGTLPFYVPVRSGRQLLEEGTFDRNELHASEARLGLENVDYDVEVLQCPVLAIDDLNLRPVFVKIDVQGFELQVLKGMEKTLTMVKPMILVEDGKATADVLEFLAPLGYRQRYWDGRKFCDKQRDGSCNFVMVPADA